MRHCRPRLLCRNGTSNPPPPASMSPDCLPWPWLSSGENSYVTITLRRGNRPHPALASPICHDAVIKPSDDVLPRRSIEHIRESMAGKTLSVEPLVDPTAKLQETTLGAYCEVGARTILLDVEMGDYSYVVNDAQMTYTTIGKFCSIAAMTRINPGNHPMHRASQAHFTYRASAYFPGESDDSEFFEWRREHHVDIGHDVWIGHGAIILPGRNIGTGAVVAAGAIVTRERPAYTIVAGHPARTIKRPFPEDIAGRVAEPAWWNWDHETLRMALPDFRNLPVEEFLAKYEAAAGSAEAQLRHQGAAS